jgi:class 3 adenylate cyclase/tetratricopeptide (TPR) repeat protein
MDVMHEGRMATATVVVCDLANSTAQRSTLGDDAADRLAVVLDRVLRGAVARYRGSVVKSTGDGLMAVFDSATDALRTAVTIQQESDRWNRASPERERLVLRIGASAGDVHFVAHDCHGIPVIEAARLESAAEPASIFVSALVRLLVGNRGDHKFESVGTLELKGLEPLEAFRVAWEPLADDDTDEARSSLAADRIPLPSRLQVRPSVGVIGYETELAAIERAVRRTSAGRGREFVLLAGEPGEGKSTVAAEAARSAFDAGACVLFGHCEESFTTPYQLFAEALGHYVVHAPEERLRAHVERHGTELARVVPALAQRVPDLPVSTLTDSDSERYLLFAAVAGLLWTEAQHQPVVLVLDDLQWADPASLHLLTHLAGEDMTARVLVLGAFRDTALLQAAALREALGMFRRHGGVERLDLRGFDHAGVVSCMEALAGYALVGDEMHLADAVYRETDGNPFYVVQILRHLVESEAIFQDPSGRWVSKGSFATITLPDSVREVIGGRVVHLGESIERMLDVAAVIGRDFDADLLGRALSIPHDELIDMLDAAASAALVRETADQPGHYSFAHALIQHTLYEGLGPTRRAAAHRRVGEALEDLCAGDPAPRVAELARHWTNGSDRLDASRAVAYSRLAGDAALRSLAPSDALRYYDDALRLWPSLSDADAVLRLDLTIGLGTAQRQAGDPSFRDTLLGAARDAIALDDSDRLVAAALALHRGWFSNFGAIDPERVDVFEQALARLSETDTRRALILSAYCLEIVVGSTLERRIELADEALAIAEASGDDLALLRVMNDLDYALMAPPMLERQLALTEDALRRAERLGDPALLFIAANWRRQACAQVGAFDVMATCTEIMRGLNEQLNQPMFSWVHTFSLAWLAIIQGDTDLAEREAAKALEIGTESGQPDAEFIYGGQIMVVHHQRGSLDTLSPLIEQMANSTPNTSGVLRGALALASVEGDRPEQARARLEAFAADGYELEMNPVWVTGMAFYAEAAIGLGDPEFAEPLFARLEPWAHLWADNGATAENPICHYLGGLAAVLGRHDVAEQYLQRSAELCESAGAQFFLAQTQLLWGRTLAISGGPGDIERARELLARASASAVARGYASVARRSAQALELLA